MNNLFILLKYNFLQFVGRFNKKDQKGSNLLGYGIVFLMAVVFAAMFSMMTYNSLKATPDNPELAIASIVSMACIFAVMSVVFKGTNLKKSNDYDLLASLPIKHSTVVLSKLSSDFLLDVSTFILTYVAGVITYVVMVKDASASCILRALIIAVSLTLISTALATFLNGLIILATRRMQNAEVIQTLFNSFITVAFLIFYFVYSTAITESNIAEEVINFYPIKLLTDFTLGFTFKNFLIICVVSIIPFIIAVIIKVLNFGKTNNKQVSNHQKITYEKMPVMKSLLRIESSRYFRSSTYVVNTIFGGLLSILFAVLLLGKTGDTMVQSVSSLLFETKGSLDADTLKVIFIILIVVFSGTAITTTSAISIEGKNFWILKVHPVSPMEILNSKILFNMLLGGICSVTASTILCFGKGYSAEYWPFIYIIPLMSVFLSSCLGLMINLRHVNLEWKDETEIIKQSVSVLIGVLIPIVPGLLVLIGYFGIFAGTISPFIFIIITFGFYLILDIWAYFLVKTKGVKEFNNLY